MTDKDKIAEQYNEFCEAFGIVKSKAILEACMALDKIVELAKAEAIKWHYPSKGEYPTDGEEVLFRCNGQNYLGIYSDTSHYFDSRDMGSPADYVECWQYIIPPKEEA